ncbi:hypothetical protein [Actinokineospora sp.]|uniref:hypothetical protein n=1 Tax=Actinokineospora sp. TaxID=1872133 RepID=UPI003D6B7774
MTCSITVNLPSRSTLSWMLTLRGSVVGTPEGSGRPGLLAVGGRGSIDGAPDVLGPGVAPGFGTGKSIVGASGGGDGNDG